MLKRQLNGDSGPTAPARWQSVVTLGAAASTAMLVFGPGDVAQGSPVVGAGTQQILARATTLDELKVNFNGIHLRTHDEVDVVQAHFTADPGWSSGWHKHAGPAIITVKIGVLTTYNSRCQKTVVPAGKAFVETPGVAVVVRNEGTMLTEWYTTQIIPVAASTREDAPQQCGKP